jgi:hypothetical protein
MSDGLPRSRWQMLWPLRQNCAKKPPEQLSSEIDDFTFARCSTSQGVEKYVARFWLLEDYFLRGLVQRVHLPEI